MTDDDPRSWPPELQRQWAETDLPGLRDFLLAQERLAMEIRRQNRELRRLADAQAEHKPPPADGPSIPLPQQECFLLADSIERLRESLTSLAAIGAQATAGRPRRRCFGLLPPAPQPPLLDAGVVSLIDGSELLGERLRDLLRGCGIEPIRPEADDAFDARLHKAVALSDDGPPGRVVELLRAGYRHRDQVLRPAEVAVGREPTITTGVDDHRNEEQP